MSKDVNTPTFSSAMTFCVGQKKIINRQHLPPDKPSYIPTHSFASASFLDTIWISIKVLEDTWAGNIMVLIDLTLSWHLLGGSHLWVSWSWLRWPRQILQAWTLGTSGSATELQYEESSPKIKWILWKKIQFVSTFVHFWPFLHQGSFLKVAPSEAPARYQAQQKVPDDGQIWATWLKNSDWQWG